ncbi:MAG TPA: FtsX-like permease family protein [Solirubrobacteraceae bacterium]|nr:FtsX-like permease family protein [Solirubrobacteraceae bacterium]
MAAVFASLTWAGLRARWQPTLLTIVVVTCAMATATVARAVGGLADDPWQQTFAATNGAHVIGIGGPQTRWQAVSTAPEVLAVAGPFQTAFASLRAGARRAPALLREGDARPSAVDRPLLVSGRWLHAGEVVLERSLAEELGLRVGDRVRLESTAARVAGIAVTSSQQAFPASQPGVVFAGRATLTAVAPERAARGTLLAVRLRHPTGAEAFADRAAQLTGGAAQFQTWGKRRADAGADTRTNQVVLSVFTLFLLLICAAVVATLVAARVVERARTVATLAAIGCTPRQATTAFAAEQVAVGLVGVLLGSAIGTALAPQFVERSSALLNVAPAASLEPLAAVLFGLVALVLIGAVAGVSAWRAGRGVVVDGLRGVRRGRDRPSRGARLADRLGLPPAAALAARDALSPHTRAALSVLALSLTVATVVAVLAMEATLDASATARPPAALPPPPGAGGLPAPYVGDTSADSAARLRAVVYALSIALLAVGAANLLATAILSVRERARDISLLRSLGASTRQLAGVVLGAQAVAAALATVIGIPIGLLAFRLAYVADNGSVDGLAWPPAWQLLALVPITTAAAALACLPAAAMAVRLRPVIGLRAARE